MNPAEPTSFPFFAIANKFGVSYLDVAKYAGRGMCNPFPGSWPARPMEIIRVPQLAESILDAVGVEKERRASIAK